MMLQARSSAETLVWVLFRYLCMIRIHPSIDPSLEPRYTLGLVWAKSLPASRGASSLDMALDLAAMNLSCSGEIIPASSSLGSTSRAPPSLPWVACTDRSAVSSFFRVLLAQGVPEGIPSSAVKSAVKYSESGADTVIGAVTYAAPSVWDPNVALVLDKSTSVEESR